MIHRPANPRDLYEGLDDATCATALALQIQDIDEILGSSVRGSSRNQAGMTEWQKTLVVHRKELLGNLNVIKDKQMSHKLAMAVYRKSSIFCLVYTGS